MAPPANGSLEVARMKAIHLPSGDQAGPWSTAGSDVIRRAASSPTIFSQISTLSPLSPVEKKAIWVPSGEKLPMPPEPRGPITSYCPSRAPLETDMAASERDETRRREHPWGGAPPACLWGPAVGRTSPE